MASGLMIDSESRLSARFGGIRLSPGNVVRAVARALRGCRRRAQFGRAGRQRLSNRALETTLRRGLERAATDLSPSGDHRLSEAAEVPS